jgi:hypothetical protein
MGIFGKGGIIIFKGHANWFNRKFIGSTYGAPHNSFIIDKSNNSIQEINKRKID